MIKKLENESKKSRSQSDIELVEMIYRLADAVVIDAVSPSQESLVRRRLALAEMTRILDRMQSGLRQQTRISSPHSWILDVLTDLAEAARTSDLSQIAERLEGCRDAIETDLAE